MNVESERNKLALEWETDPRWKGITRNYTPDDVLRLRGSVRIEQTLAERGSKRLWERLNKPGFIRALGALTGNQAVQQVQAGLEGIYVSGWQVAGDANNAGQMYPDQSLYPVDSVPKLVKRINNALQRADQIHMGDGDTKTDWFAPIVADAEAGFGGNLNTFELMKSMIEAGASGVHFEDQLSSLKKCGHMGGKVLVPVVEFEQKLVAARLAADVLGVPSVVVARTDAHGANLIRSDFDDRDRKFIPGGRTAEGYFHIKGGLDLAIERGRAYAPYADVVWCETSTPDVGEAREFAQGVHEKFPGKILAYNCSPSFNWRAHLDERTIRTFQEQLGEMGYKFQFVTLAGFHALNTAMFELATGYNKFGMAAYAKLQNREFQLEEEQGYEAIKHQKFVGAGYFDDVQMVISQGKTSTSALAGSTEEEQFG
jgi:isocitrate lyase